MKNKFSLGFFVFIAIALSAAPKQQEMSRNGTFWNNTSPPTKVGYVEGVMDGMFEEMSIMEVLSPQKDRGGDHVFIEAQRSMLVRKDGKTPHRNEILDGINAFYRIPENLPVCQIHAVEIEWSSLAGYPLTAQAISEYREEDGKAGCP